MFRHPWMNAHRFDELRREMDQILQNVGSRLSSVEPFGGGAFPLMNVWDGGEALYVEAELPGVKLDDLEITAIGNELSIKGQRRPAEQEKMVFHRRERRAGAFHRTLTLPVDVDAERVDAVAKDGVLTIRLPKAESARPRKIEVRVS